MLWVMLVLSLIEMGVVHALVAMWWPAFAVGLSLVSMAAVVWIVRLIVSLRTRLPEVRDGVLTMRAGVLGVVAIPVAAIGGLRADWSAATLRAPGVVNLALMAWPNIVIDLAEPVVGRRGRAVQAVAHKLDDPDAFRAWIATLPQGAGLR
ncbi:hypothetical protein ACFSGX_11680 [Sphingomonas arantia]|uniref:FxsA protein n=1 Tax=Sphingomonas arantia TaxID=1460676 RepID=A0ABW4TXI6_9SPHN